MVRGQHWERLGSSYLTVASKMKKLEQKLVKSLCKLLSRMKAQIRYDMSGLCAKSKVITFEPVDRF